MANRKILFTQKAHKHLSSIEQDLSKKNILKAVRKTIALMETNLRHPSLQTHEFTALKGPNNEKVFEAYVQQHTPGAYRIFWCYGPGKNELTILAIVQHPNKTYIDIN